MERRNPNRMPINVHSHTKKLRIIMYAVKQLKKRCISDAFYKKEVKYESVRKDRC